MLHRRCMIRVSTCWLACKHYLAANKLSPGMRWRSGMACGRPLSLLSGTLHGVPHAADPGGPARQEGRNWNPRDSKGGAGGGHLVQHVDYARARGAVGRKDHAMEHLTQDPPIYNPSGGRGRAGKTALVQANCGMHKTFGQSGSSKWVTPAHDTLMPGTWLGTWAYSRDSRIPQKNPRRQRMQFKPNRARPGQPKPRARLSSVCSAVVV